MLYDPTALTVPEQLRERETEREAKFGTQFSDHLQCQRFLNGGDNSACVLDWNEHILGQLTHTSFMKCAFYHLHLLSEREHLHILSCLSWASQRDTTRSDRCFPHMCNWVFPIVLSMCWGILQPLSFGSSHCVVPISRVIHMSGMKRWSWTGSTDNATLLLCWADDQDCNWISWSLDTCVKHLSCPAIRGFSLHRLDDWILISAQGFLLSIVRRD